MTSDTPRHLFRIVTALACTVLTTTLHAQIAPTASPSPAEAAAATKDSIVTLSPFTVTSESEKGYLATQTLNGTRLNTSLRDVGAAMSIFTERLLDDLAASSIYDLVAFAPNTDPYVGNVLDTSGNGNAFLTTQSPQYVTRGGNTALISQDFFSTPAVPPDRYNAENLTFTRGPNAILFGLGNPAGAFTSSSKRAQFKNAYQLELRGDDNGGLRTSIDLNRVLVPNRLALRYAGLHEDAEGFREPSGNSQRRHFFAARYTPFRSTSLRANYEFGRLKTLAIRPWPSYDGITPWIDAGRPLLATAGSGRTPPAGIQNAFGAAAQSLVVTDNTPAGTVVPPMSWLNQGRSANPSFPNYPNLATFRSLVNPDLFPTTANVVGQGARRDLDFHTIGASWEQQIGRDFFLEASFNRTLSDTIVNSSLAGQSDRLYIDVNRQLPNGSPNPNVGLLYVDSFANILPNKFLGTTERLMMSYDLDFAKFWPRAGRWLGSHRIAAFGENGVSDTWGSQNPSHNVTPLPGANASILDLTNRVIFRYYLEPAKGATTAGFNAAERYPVIFANDPLPARNASGVTSAQVAIFGGTSAQTRLITQAFATQSSFWGGRLVVTFGGREDTQITYRGTQTDFDPWRDSRGIYPNPRLFGARNYFPRSRLQVAGQTYTRGAVLHALPWLSLFANQSNNLQPNATSRDIAGRLVPNQEGKGEDYGLKFNLLQGRIVADVLYYKNFGRNRPDQAVANGLHGNFQNDINAIWTTLAARENKPEYLANPYAYTGSVWFDTNTGYSDGYEATVTANLKPEWRLTLNASKRGPGKTIERGSLTAGYLAQYLPLWKGNAGWMSTPLAEGSSGGGTIASAVARLENTLANFNALAALPTDSLFAPEWSANFITSYDFAAASRLKGISVGASANLRGPTVIGFAETAGGVAIADRPYYARDFNTTGAWVSYRRRLSNKVNWRVQLNVRNVLDENKLFPHRAVDRRDGTGRPAVAIYRLNEPRTFVLTSAFSF
jgi:iron complex outermembrane receptor protein